MTYNRINNLTGWVIFAISLVVFLMTMAPTASFWDCGEFISCCNELEVPHPPGPPVFLLLGRIMAMFAGKDVTQIAYMVNLVSVLSSAFCVLFIFWSITLLGRKLLLEKGEEADMNKTVLLMFAGAVGALACAFSDSFWFNAVEAEVYAMSSLCTAVVVWLMLKWETRADEPDHLRWIVLLAYVVGLSISVHLLNLLAIPGLALIYYFRKYDFSLQGLLVTLGISVVILGAIQIGVIQWTMQAVMIIEMKLVGLTKVDGSIYHTGLNMPQSTGLWVFSLLLAGITGGLLWYSHKRNIAWLNISTLSYLTIMVGYSTYMVIALRANAGVPINENDPGNVPSMLSYMKREQYGDNPLLSGPLYNAQPVGTMDKGENYVKWKEPFWFPMEDGSYKTADGQSFTVKNGVPSGVDIKNEIMLSDSTPVRVNPNSRLAESKRVINRYVWDGAKKDYKYRDKDNVVFPRMHSASHFDKSQHAFGYEKYVKRHGREGDPSDDKPTQAENFEFFLDYQMRHMYWRYFGWNFIGRENDIQEAGTEAGFFLGNMPEGMRKDPSRNHYYALPLLLGIFGLVWQLLKRPKDFSVMIAMFFFTGVAIIIYLNQTPSQPRERDYSYVGSFQTFCIWIGLGVIAVYDLLQSFLKNATQYVVGGATMVLIPGIMLQQNFNDHSRHFQYVPPDSAYNLLMSCKPNALLFTNGDNDTFPLWYIQEVEGVRTDVRVVNLSLLNTDWYIDQMRKQSNQSAPLPISISEFDYRGDRSSTVSVQAGEVVNIPVDRQKVIENGLVRPEDAYLIESPMRWTPRTRGSASNPYYLKQDYLIRNIVETNAKNGWDRPIYFSSTIPTSSFMELGPWFQAEGLAYRLVPYKKQKLDPYPIGFVDAERTYTLLKDTFKYRELTNPELYLDEHIRRTIIGNINNCYYREITNLIEGAKQMEEQNAQRRQAVAAISATGGSKTTLDSLNRMIAIADKKAPEYKKMAKELLDFREEKMPHKLIEVDMVLLDFFAQAYLDLNEKEKGVAYLNDVVDKLLPMFEYYKEQNMKEKYDERDETAITIAAQNLAKAGEGARAAEVMARLYKVTGDPRHQQLMNQLEQTAPPAPKPAAQDCLKQK